MPRPLKKPKMSFRRKKEPTNAPAPRSQRPGAFRNAPKKGSMKI